MKYKYLLTLLFLVACTEHQRGFQYPQQIGKYNLLSIISGDSAISEINTLHRSEVAAAENVIIRYGKAGQDILYISKYENTDKSKSELDKMIDKMQSIKNSPFGFIVPMKKYEKSFMTLGMGSVHYIYQSGKYLLWLSTKQKFYNELPIELTDIYPAN